MKKFYTILAAALLVLTANAGTPQLLYPANGDIIEPADGAVAPRVLQRVEGSGPARANRLTPTNISGTYIDCYLPVVGISGRKMSHSVKITQSGSTVYIDGLGGFGQENLANNSVYTWIAPIQGSIDLATGIISVKAGQKLAQYEDTTFDNLVPYVGNFLYTNNGSLRYGNYTSNWAHIEGDKIVFDVNPVFLAFSGSVPGSMSNAPLGGEYSPVFNQANGILSYVSTDTQGYTSELTTPMWYEYGHDASGARTLSMSNVFAENGAGYNIEWTIEDDDTALATNQIVWGSASSPYYFQAITNRSGFSRTVPADVSKRHHITWPKDYDNKKYVAWTILNTITGDYLANNEPATIIGLWDDNYPALCVLNDEVGWNPSQPMEVSTTSGIYEFEVPAGINEFAISLLKGANYMDMATYQNGMLVTEALAAVQPGQVYSLINGYSIDDDVISLPEHEDPITVYVDIDYKELWIKVPEPAVPAIAVTFEGMAEAQGYEADPQSGVYSFTLPEGTKSFTLVDPDGEPLTVNEVIADNTGNTDYPLVSGSDAISVAYAEGQWTIYLDLEASVLFAINDTDAPITDTICVYWDNETSEFANPMVHYSMDGGITYQQGVMMTQVTDEPDSAPARVYYSSSNQTLYVAVVPAGATHIYFTDGGDDATATETFEAVSDGYYDGTGLVTISNVGIDTTMTGGVAYYTLQGMRISRPTAGSVVVRVAADGRATKIVVR